MQRIMYILICLFAASTATLAKPIKIVGTIVDVSGSRLVLNTATGTLDLDIGTVGVARLRAKVGDKIQIAVDRNPLIKGRHGRNTKGSVAEIN
jgi:hypothetical protein